MALIAMALIAMLPARDSDVLLRAADVSFYATWLNDAPTFLQVNGKPRLEVAMQPRHRVLQYSTSTS